jgi:hypothetical protein
MEQSKFNLQQSIDGYINLIKSQGSITNSDAAELSAHLYDATEALQKQNLSEEEAFLIACKRLGKESDIAEEYSKVNPSINTNKIWAYLFIGVNLLAFLPKLAFMFISAFYFAIHRQFQATITSAWIVICFNLLLVYLIWYIVSKKNKISGYIEKQVNHNAIRFVSICFVPFILFFLGNLQFHISGLQVLLGINFPIREFHNRFVEFSFYLVIFSIVGGILSLIFTINKRENFRIEALFNKPSTLFLLTFGVLIEMLAASTRVLPTGNILYSALIFGIVYLTATYFITYYNKQGNINKYLTIFSMFGIVMEIGVGINADLYRGNTYNTVYFVSALIICILLGRLLGLKYAKNEFLEITA